MLTWRTRQAASGEVTRGEDDPFWPTESPAMVPAASFSGFYSGRPEARYFAVDMITRDQVEDYARRKGTPLAEVEK